MTWLLRYEGHAVTQTRIRRLLRLMRWMPIDQKPDPNRPAKGHKSYPYLLGGPPVERPKQVWCTNITYLPHSFQRRGDSDLPFSRTGPRKALRWSAPLTSHPLFHAASAVHGRLIAVPQGRVVRLVGIGSFITFCG